MRAYRMIGICLIQLEIFPLHLCRHVLKFILGRPINWFDLAFYDPVLFESMRTLVFNEGPTRPEQINSLYLTFEVTVPEQEVEFYFSDILISLVLSCKADMKRFRTGREYQNSIFVCFIVIIYCPLLFLSFIFPLLKS